MDEEGESQMLKHDFDEIIDRRHTGCNKYDAYPEEVLPMWVADTDFKCPQPIIDAMVKRAQHGIYGYTNYAKSFNRAVVGWESRRFGWDIEEDWVLFTPSVVPALACAVQVFTHPGDHVVVQMPIYHPIHQVPRENGRVISNNQLILRNGCYYIDFEDLENRLRHPRARMMILCHPHNPVGKAFTQEELLRIGELCAKHHVLVLSDEIHHDIVFPGSRHFPFPTLSEAHRDNCVVCINPSKTFNIAGVRTGAAIIPNKRLREAYNEGIVNNRINGRTVFGLTAFETAYNECAYYADQIVDYLVGNLRFMTQYFNDFVPQIKVCRMQATYLAWLDCRALGLSQTDLVRFMLEKAKVALNDGESFGSGGTGFMRLNFACPRATLEKGLKSIRAAVQSL
jgi:cystathionine beta-lyase